MMIPVIMNTNFVRLAEIDDYISFIWSTRYYAVGDFELCVSTDSDLSLFQKDFYVVRDDDENVGIIENLVIQRNEDGNEMLIIKGRFLSSILERRIIAVQTTVNGAISSCVNQLINENVINPTITARKIANFVLGSYSINEMISAQYTGKNLLETISDLSMTYGVGFKTVLNSQNQFVFSMYKGVDHTYDQTDRPYVIFSDKYDNLLSSEYEENYQQIATAVLVAGEGEGTDRKTLWVTDGSTGLQRHEVYKDQRNIQSDDGEITDAEYYDLLNEEGKECLTKYTTAFAGTVYFDNVKYKEDVNVGDLCVIENSRWGIYMNTRLVEVIESVSETGEYKIVPTFGV
jgi:hypothetical protein